MEVRHLDGIKFHNWVGNLAWGTKSENEQDKLRHGTNNHASKTHCDSGHEFTPGNTHLRLNPDGSIRQRDCRACHRKACREYMQRKRAAQRAALRGMAA